jgi:hypothetical protein
LAALFSQTKSACMAATFIYLMLSGLILSFL